MGAGARLRGRSSLDLHRLGARVGGAGGGSGVRGGLGVARGGVVRGRRSLLLGLRLVEDLVYDALQVL